MASVRKVKWTRAGVTKTAWAVDWRAADGKRRQQQFEFKRDADARRKEIEHEEVAGSKVVSGKSLKELRAEFERYLEDRMKAGVIGREYLKLMRGTLTNGIIAELGYKPLCDLTIVDVENFDRSLAARGLATQTIKVYRATFRRFEVWAQRRGHTLKCITDEAYADIPLARPEPIKIPTKEDVEAIRTSASGFIKHTKKRTQAFAMIAIDLAIFCGMRFGEIAALPVGAVNLETRTVHIRESLAPLSGYKITKTRSGIRDVPLPPHIVERIGDWLRRHYVQNEGNRLFTSSPGGPINRANFQPTWRRILHQAGLTTETRFHSLRHFAGSWWIENGMPITEASKLLGHKNPAITMSVYAHSLRSNAEMRATLETLSSALLRPRSEHDARQTDNLLISHTV